MLPAPSSRLQGLDSLVDQALQDGLFLGAAWRVFRKPDQVLASGRMGLAQEEPAIRVAANTVWDLASLTKPLCTASAILILAEAGEFHLEEEVRRFLPGQPENLRGITIRHCLCHTSGLPAWVRLFGQGWSRDEILARVRSLSPEAEPGSTYTYSDPGYILLGDLVEQVTERPFQLFVEDWILDPLGLRGTRFIPPEEWERRIAATRCPERTAILVGLVHDANCDAMDSVAGHAGLFGTLDDLTLLARLLLNEGEVDGSRVLQPWVCREMLRNQNPPPLPGHTLGWFARPNPLLPAGDFWPEDTIGHTGFTGTSMLLSPSAGTATILLTNRVYMGNDGKEFLRFRKLFHNVAASLVS